MSSRSRRKGTASADGFDISSSEPARKRARGSKSEKIEHIPSRMMELPTELQLLILFYCDKRSLAAISCTCNHFNEISMRVMWEMQPVDALESNFDMLDQFDDLRTAVKHLRVSQNFIGINAKALTEAGKHLIQRFKDEEEYFPSLTHFTIDVHGWQAGPFAKIMEALCANQPKRLKGLTVSVGEIERNYYFGKSSFNKKEAGIHYPSGMTFIKINFAFFKNAKVDFDPFKVLRPSKDTVVDVDMYIEEPPQEHIYIQCPKVKRLAFGQPDYSHTRQLSQQIAFMFPNVERLEIRGKQNKGVMLSQYANNIMQDYAQNFWQPNVTTIKFVYSVGAIYSRKKKEARDIMIEHLKRLAAAWSCERKMPLLRRIEAFKGPNMSDHSFNIEISREGFGDPHITVRKIILLAGDKEKEEEEETA